MNRNSSIETKNISEVAKLIQFFLRESPSESIKLANAWKNSHTQAEKDWLSIGAADGELLFEQVNNVHLPEEDALARYLQGITSGILLTTLHMSHYLLVGLKILSYLKNRKIVFIRKREDSSEESNAFSKLNALDIKWEVIRHSEKSAHKLYSRLKSGCVVIAPFDLSFRWGVTTNINFLGRNVHWVSGPGLLAFKAKSVVIPFYATHLNGIYRCHLSRVYDFSHRNSGVSNYVELCQILGNMATEAVREFPDQWHQWHLTSEMMQSSDESTKQQ